MTDNHISAGPMMEIHDADFDAIKQELHDEHKLHCESDHDPYIWIDTTHAWSDGRNIYVNAACQNCMKGSDRTPVREDQKFHIQTKTTRKRRSDDLSH